MALRVAAAARTDVGLVRKNNQDTYASDSTLGLYVVCDGMGGAAGGEVASKIAAETFIGVAKQELEANKGVEVETTRRALSRAAAAANRAVSARADKDPEYTGMGTTLVGMRVVGSTLTAINVGDSRAYLVRQGRAIRLTIDHSYVAEQVRLGAMTEAQAESSNMQSLITRAIGAEPDVYPDLFEHPLHPGDAILLTSDGLTRHVTDEEIADVLSPLTSATPDEACSRLIEMAKDGGGSDNITCVVLRLSRAEQSPGF